jgi:hypothetical protein
LSEDGSSLPSSNTAAARIIAQHRTRHHKRLEKVAIGSRPAVFRSHQARWTAELATDLAGLTPGTDETWFAELVQGETLARLERDAQEATRHES